MASDHRLKTIVYTPVGEEIKDGELSREDALSMIDSLQQLNSIGVIHRNLVPKHFLKCPKTQKLFIIDYGWIYLIDESDRDEVCMCKHLEKCHEYQGTVQFAPIEVLEHFVGER